MPDPFAVAVTRWYHRHARDLPWRREGTSAWAILVSEFMLQQTPVSRVRPAWEQWVQRWPTPVAVMELGAVVCTARAPACTACPVAAQCAWLAAGRPPSAVTRASPRYDGTDREARGRLLAVLRERHEPVSLAELDLVWADAVQ